MDISQKIKNARKDAGLTQADLAKACGVTRNAVTLWESSDPDRRTTPSLDNLNVISQLTGAPIGSFLGVQEDSANYNTTPAITPHGKEIPVISFVQAGEFNETIDLHQPGYADEWIPRATTGRNVYALRVQGESMTAPAGQSPTFPEGTLIHVDPDQETGNGNYVIARVKGASDVTFKQLKYEDGKPYLKALNPMWSPIFDEFHILGRVVYYGGSL